MALAYEKALLIPSRVLAALNQAGMPAEEIADHYDLTLQEVAVALSAAPEPLRVEDLEWLEEDSYRYELWDGELWRMSPTKKRHGRGTTRIVALLLRFLEANPIGELYFAEVGFQVGSRRLLSPDAAYVRNERDEPVGDDEFFPYAPDIAVEVLSPDNTRPKVRRKARAYLASGGKLVWAIDTRRKHVTVFRPSAEPEVLSGDDTLSGEDVLPGFEVRVTELF